ncbi:MAG: ATP-dependent zinc metalloprotease FtsH, partial [Cyanobacteria bacterium HKST-UBA06]|nr:ATP-dependent zinc metalloprotease FtsH [Cyanobacteria bacterium HKST-UBA06]
MKKHQTSGFVILGFILLLILFASTLIFKNEGSLPQEINQTELVQLAKEGKLKEVSVKDRELSALGTNKTQYHIILPSNEITSDRIIQQLSENNVNITQLRPEQSGKWLSILTTLILPLGIIGLFIVLFRSAQAGGSQAMSFGKSRAKLMPENKVKITFKDVAGIQEPKEELEEVVDFLKNSERYLKLGARIPKGVLLVGAPGTGKTLLAKAVAGEAGVAFFSISGSDFVEMFVGVGASRVRDLFEQAKKHSPCIIFIDEIDAVGRQRGAGLGGSHDEREQTLNQILVEMDGFDTDTHVIILAATNRPDILDPALMRPGRFDRRVVIDRPDMRGREAIFKVHLRGKPIAGNVNVQRLAKSTPGFVGADIENTVNEAALLAARRNKKNIGMAEFQEAVERVQLGPERKSRVITPEEKEIIAYHEAGHALVSHFLPAAPPLRKITIVPRGMGLGLTWYMENDNLLPNKSQLRAQIASTLGGRVAEEIVFGEVTSGASNDLQRVTQIARLMVTQYGMSEDLGLRVYGQKQEMVFLGREISEQRDYSDAIAEKIDEEVRQIIDEQYTRATEILTGYRKKLDLIARHLLERETLDAEEFVALIEGETLAPPSSGSETPPTTPKTSLEGE